LFSRPFFLRYLCFLLLKFPELSFLNSGIPTRPAVRRIDHEMERNPGGLAEASGSFNPASCAVLACLLEATARKPGNVHPAASFRDLTYADFVRSAHLIGPTFEHADDWSVGRLVLDAVARTRREVATNTNLGILLLLAPLASVPAGISIADGIGAVLAKLTREDARLVYQAIRLANPGGLGQVEHEDVAAEPSVTLLEAMQLAADRDRIAEQYANNFATVIAGAKRLAAQGAGEASSDFVSRWEEAVIELHLWLMAEFPDTLIARKCGGELVRESAQRARVVLAAGWPDGPSASHRMAEFDTWLRADGNRRNPGTTADLVAGCLFAALREGWIAAPEMFVRPGP
jgi:triphosphoribosyl-dephospho-CoA synthase